MEGVIKLKPFAALRSARFEHPPSVTVTVVGAGGIGARVIPLLCKILPDRSTIKVIDHDIVEERNCLRQPFIFEDIGVPKAVVMQERYDGRVTVNAVVGQFEEGGISICPDDDSDDRVHFLLGCVDNTTTRYQMLTESVFNVGSWYRNHAYIDAGNDGPRGQVLVAYACLRTPTVNECKIHGARLWPEVFTPKMTVTGDYAPPEIESCDRVDTQTVLANQMAATMVAQYVQMLLTGGMVGNLGATFDIRGGMNIRKLWALNVHHTLLLRPDEEQLEGEDRETKLILPMNYDGPEFVHTLRKEAIAAAKLAEVVKLEAIPVEEPAASPAPAPDGPPEATVGS